MTLYGICVPRTYRPYCSDGGSHESTHEGGPKYLLHLLADLQYLLQEE